MAEKRTRRTKTEVINAKIEKINADKAKYAEKIAELDDELKELQNQLNLLRQDEVMAAINESGLSLDEAINRIKG